MTDKDLITIIATVIGTGATSLTLFLLILIKFVKEPLDKKVENVGNEVKETKTDLQSQFNSAKSDLQSQIDRVEKKVDKLYELLLDYFMNQPKGHRGEQGDMANIKE